MSLISSSTIGILYKAVSFIERVKISKVSSVNYVNYSPGHSSFLFQFRYCFVFNFDTCQLEQDYDVGKEVIFLSNEVCNYKCSYTSK